MSAVKAALLAGLIALASCGDQEAAQRQAFITFLQTRILAHPGIHAPTPSDSERRAFGPYADQYEVILDFNRAVNASSEATLGKVPALADSFTGLRALVDHKADLAQLKTALAAFEAIVQARLTAADTARAAFPAEPSALRDVYAQAYDRDVTTPARTYLAAIPILRSITDDALAVTDFVAAHRAALTIGGGGIAASDTETRDGLNALLTRLNADAEQAGAVSETLAALTPGSGD